MSEPIIAYVLIKVDVGKVSAVFKDILRLKNIQKATIVTGEYDIVAELSNTSVEDILSTVAHRIHQISNVKETKTLVGARMGTQTPKSNL